MLAASRDLIPRARFAAECVWDLKESSRKMGSNLVVGGVLGGCCRRLMAEPKTEPGVRVWITRSHGNMEGSE